MSNLPIQGNGHSYFLLTSSARSSGNGVRLPSTAVSSKLSEAKPERVLNDDEELNDVLPGDTSAIEFSEDFGDLQMTDA